MRLAAAILAAMTLVCTAFVVGQTPGTQAASSPAGVRFEALDVFVDAGDKALAAYQVEIWDARHVSKIVGIEGGEHAAFREPPRYDPAAMQNDRVVLAAFNTGGDLPTGRVRVARLHVAVEAGGEPRFSAKLVTAGSADGVRMAAEVSVSKGDGL